MIMTGTAHIGAEPGWSAVRAPDGHSISQEGRSLQTSPQVIAAEDSSNGGVAVAADKVSAWARIRPISADSVDPAEVARTAQERVPTNAYGLPLGIYRADLMAPHQVLRGQLLPEDLPEPPEPEPGYVARANSRFIRHNGKPVLVLDERVLRQAYVGLNYDEGYPVLEGGVSFWDRLPWEPHEAFVAFQAYLEQGLKGMRHTASLSVDERLQHKILGALSPEYRPQANASGAASPVVAAGGQSSPEGGYSGSQNGDGPALRLLDGALSAQGSEATVVPTEVYDRAIRVLGILREWYHVYQWAYRAKAYDQFFVASLQRQRQMMAMRLEGEHFLIGERLAQKALIFMGLKEPIDGKIPEEALTEDGRNKFWQDAKPKDILEALTMATKLQRISLGMQGAAPSQPIVVHQSTTVQAGATSTSSGAKTDKSAGTGDNAAPPELTDDERARRIASILDAARARAAGRAPVVGEDTDVAAPSGTAN